MKIKQMLTVNKIIISFTLLIITSCTKVYTQDYNGKWIAKNNYIDIELELKQTGNIIEGGHCIIYGAEGNYMDCSDVNQKTINGILENGKVILDIQSKYVDGIVKISLELLSDGKLAWKLINYPKGIFFYPDSIYLEKDN
ncbi:hypothetical protein [Flavobacterium pokkalii]|nr:hypothetical protein [Flavobacterium pokkalii]